MDMPLMPSDDLSRPKTLMVAKKIIKHSIEPVTAD